MLYGSNGNLVSFESYPAITVVGQTVTILTTFASTCVDFSIVYTENNKAATDNSLVIEFSQ